MNPLAAALSKVAGDLDAAGYAWALVGPAASGLSLAIWGATTTVRIAG